MLNVVLYIKVDFKRFVFVCLFDLNVYKFRIEKLFNFRILKYVKINESSII